MNDWLHDEPSHSPVESLMDWMRQTIAHSRRPFGIDHFDLALAWRPLSSQNVRTTRFTRLRPADLYDDGLLDQLKQFFLDHLDPHPPRRVAVALHSWGDVAYEAIEHR